MRLYIEGHQAKQGYVISREWSDAECSELPTATAAELTPVRFVSDMRKAKAMVQRYNRRFATH
ncbi:hypothetical protein P245_19725 [Comamonas thiooxydans]|uniref:Uncharacterized protein n=1 Tax=Comamonas thiooxydans TaxID=363952 RepID=A0A0E3BBD0_9BURK|nr:hypothetical protein [Comamonas thiooxydans]KGG87683.1 hypothetical protein P245_19725 [Comamonas thiooxydans]